MNIGYSDSRSYSLDVNILQHLHAVWFEKDSEEITSLWNGTDANLTYITRADGSPCTEKVPICCPTFSIVLSHINRTECNYLIGPLYIVITKAYPLPLIHSPLVILNSNSPSSTWTTCFWAQQLWRGIKRAGWCWTESSCWCSLTLWENDDEWREGWALQATWPHDLYPGHTGFEGCKGLVQIRTEVEKMAFTWFGEICYWCS